MARRIGIRDVANKAGVAVSSVSRVISGHPNISPDMKERVLAAVQAMGYEPSILAQNLRSGTTRTIGLLVPDISNPLFSELVFHLETALDEAGFSLLIANSLANPERDRTHLNNASSAHCYQQRIFIVCVFHEVSQIRKNDDRAWPRSHPLWT